MIQIKSGFPPKADSLPAKRELLRDDNSIMKRILVVEVNWLGDCILTLPIFKALKDKVPSSHVGVMAPSRVLELFKDNPYIDELVEFDEKTTHKSLFSKIKFVSSLSEKKFDTVILIHRSFTRTFLCVLAGIKQRVGFKRIKTAFLVNRKVPLPELPLHRGDYYCLLAEGIGVPVKEKNPRFFLKKDEKLKAEEFIKVYRQRYKHLVAINPSCNWVLKMWPRRYFIELIEELTNIGAGVFLIGAKKDMSAAEEIVKKRNKSVINLCGKTSLRELAAILEKMDVLVSGDSGPAHLAASLEKKVLVLFGPTSPSITAPRGKRVYILKGHVDCEIPCYNSACDNNICMKMISPVEVFLKLKQILEDQK